MTKRIFLAVFLASLGVFLASVLLFIGVLYPYFSDIQRAQLRIQAELAAKGAAGEGLAYFEDLETDDCRITWIREDGTVLYDNRSDSANMENHLERQEIRQALAGGTGESVRDSVTLWERTIYYARRLPDGTILRLSMAQNTLFSLFLSMLHPLSAIFAAALFLSLALASHLSKAIVKPFNHLNLNAPAKQGNYKELAPLFEHIAAQQRQIRTQAEELRQKQDEFETVTTGMAEGLLLLNKKEMILSINPAAMRLFETDRSCIGKYLLSVNHSLALQELLQKASEGRHAECVMKLGEKSYQFGASPVFSDGFVSGIVLLLLDVTEKEDAEKMRREFTANVSHELKTPLHVISGRAELIRDGMVKPEDISLFSGQIYTETQRMICLVEDIIRLSHLDEGYFDRKWEKVDLFALAKAAIQAFLPAAKQSGIRIELFGEASIINGIPLLLEGILFNLLDNAVKYNRKGGSVSVTVKTEEKEAVLSVADTGIGIPAEFQDRIFERFFRVDKSHSKQTGGTGLGLSIVKHSAMLHRARIEVQSSAGSGTTITLYFTKTLQK